MFVVDVVDVWEGVDDCFGVVVYYCGDVGV